MIKDILKWNPSWFCKFLRLERFNNLFDSHIINSYLICLAMFSILYLSCKPGIREKKNDEKFCQKKKHKQNNSRSEHMNSQNFFHRLFKLRHSCDSNKILQKFVYSAWIISEINGQAAGLNSSINSFCGKIKTNVNFDHMLCSFV
jgi:hypothetical protein